MSGVQLGDSPFKGEQCVARPKIRAGHSSGLQFIRLNQNIRGDAKSFRVDMYPFMHVFPLL